MAGKGKKDLATKEGVLKHKKEELEKIIATTEKEEKHFNKLAAMQGKKLMRVY